MKNIQNMLMVIAEKNINWAKINNFLMAKIQKNHQCDFSSEFLVLEMSEIHLIVRTSAQQIGGSHSRENVLLKQSKDINSLYYHICDLEKVSKCNVNSRNNKLPSKELFKKPFRYHRVRLPLEGGERMLLTNKKPFRKSTSQKISDKNQFSFEISSNSYKNESRLFHKSNDVVFYTTRL